MYENINLPAGFRIRKGEHLYTLLELSGPESYTDLTSFETTDFLKEEAKRLNAQRPSVPRGFYVKRGELGLSVYYDLNRNTDFANCAILYKGRISHDSIFIGEVEHPLQLQPLISSFEIEAKRIYLEEGFKIEEGRLVCTSGSVKYLYTDTTVEELEEFMETIGSRSEIDRWLYV